MLFNLRPHKHFLCKENVKNSFSENLLYCYCMLLEQENAETKLDIQFMLPFSWTLSPLNTVYGFIFWVEEERLSEHEYRQDGSHLSMQAKEDYQYIEGKAKLSAASL
jgi:hypothetical protein